MKICNVEVINETVLRNHGACSEGCYDFTHAYGFGATVSTSTFARDVIDGTNNADVLWDRYQSWLKACMPEVYDEIVTGIANLSATLPVPQPNRRERVTRVGPNHYRIHETLAEKEIARLEEMIAKRLMKIEALQSEINMLRGMSAFLQNQ